MPGTYGPDPGLRFAALPSTSLRAGSMTRRRGGPFAMPGTYGPEPATALRSG